MRFYKKFWLIVPALLLQGCPGLSGYTYNTRSFPVNPVNLKEINTEYDDYNSSSPVLGKGIPLCFSSNRPGGLRGFDLYYVGIPDIAYPN